MYWNKPRVPTSCLNLFCREQNRMSEVTSPGPHPTSKTTSSGFQTILSAQPFKMSWTAVRCRPFCLMYSSGQSILTYAYRVSSEEKRQEKLSKLSDGAGPQTRRQPVDCRSVLSIVSQNYPSYTPAPAQSMTRFEREGAWFILYPRHRPSLHSVQHDLHNKHIFSIQVNQHQYTYLSRRLGIAPPFIVISTKLYTPTLSRWFIL